MSLQNITTAANGLSNLILAIPNITNILSAGYQPTLSYLNSVYTSVTSNPALVFHYEGEQTVVFESEITDNWAEDNSAIQDQIALKPVMVTTHGFIGELNDILPAPLQAIQTAAETLVTLPGLQPSLSVTALNALNTAILLYENAASTANAAVSAYSALGGPGSTGESTINAQGIIGGFNSSSSFLNSQSQQQKYFTQLYGYWSNRTLFTIQTPWAIFDNMAIKSVRAIQDAETRMISDFEVTFKQINFAAELSSVSSFSANRLSNQISSGIPTQNGVINPNSAAVSQTTALSAAVA